MQDVKLNKLLKEEILTSMRYNLEHGGDAPIADDFMPMMEEILRSDTVASMMLTHRDMLLLAQNNIVVSAVKLVAGGDTKGKLGKIIAENRTAFLVPLAMFYWGMKIGRMLQSKDNATNLAKESDFFAQYEKQLQEPGHADGEV